MTPEEIQNKLFQLEQKINLIEKQQIKIVGTFDGTNIPITVDGIRRKIATSAP